MGKNKRYASTRAAPIESVLSKGLRFSLEAEAIEKLGLFGREFILSKDGRDEERSLVLWVRGYDLTSEDKKQGLVGNYMRVSVAEEGGKFVIVGERHQTTLGPPQINYNGKNRGEQNKHPNWGHPVLRRVVKKFLYSSEDEARADLDRLQEEYPLVSMRPTRDKLYCTVYSAKYGKNRTRHLVFEIIEKERGVIVDSYENVHQGKVPRRKMFVLPSELRSLQMVKTGGRV